MIDLIHGDALEVLRTLDAGSVQCCVTSPPYWGLRDYGTAEWEGGDSECDHRKPATGGNPKQGPNKGNNNDEAAPYRDMCGKCGAKRVDKQLGLEKTPEKYVAKMVELFREVRRVLRDDGTAWVNLGDSYASGGGMGGAGKSAAVGNTKAGIQGRAKTPHGLKPKDLCGIPWRVALALQADGWYLRQDIIWHKPNPMPESVTDRCTKAHEYIFLLSKSGKTNLWRAKDTGEWSYEADLSETFTDSDGEEKKRWMGYQYYFDNDAIREKTGNEATQEEYEAADGRCHFHENDLECGMMQSNPARKALTNPRGRNKRSVWTVPSKPLKEAHFATFPPDLIQPCIEAGCPVGGTVLEPFGGSGTVALLCQKLDRSCVSIELNPEYHAMCQRRVAQGVDMLTGATKAFEIEMQRISDSEGVDMLTEIEGGPEE